MRPNMLHTRWTAGQPIINGWLAIPSGFSAEVMAHCGWDSLTIDIQHGLVDYQTAAAMMQAISTTDVTPLVRVPWNDPAIIMKCLDAGAYGVICPMVNNAEEARRFVGACRYPPAPGGYRSLGPIRAQIYGGPDYIDHANETVVTLAMIETRDGVKNLDEILAVEGLDGVYIGPADLGQSLGFKGQMDPTEPKVVEAMEHVLARCKAMGKRCGSHTGSTAYAKALLGKGFDLVTLMSDNRLLAAAASAVVREMKGDGPAPIGAAPGSAAGSRTY